jgi:hypothetical protein
MLYAIRVRAISPFRLHLVSFMERDLTGTDTNTVPLSRDETVGWLATLLHLFSQQSPNESFSQQQAGSYSSSPAPV